ncbi:unnamed protein product [Prorocentrum cordatum]|uniref:Uncharacterized protein n=1 Tax=Prorocentrum cordatum TaxID=2364126 RepID=A0ABN9SQ56_9DINO|nr:unnamed protein product [Polarella glacialis]
MAWGGNRVAAPLLQRAGGKQGFRARRRLVMMTFNANLSLNRVLEFLEDEVHSVIGEGDVPIEAAQGRGKSSDCPIISGAAEEAKGWRVAGAPAVSAAEGGRSAGVAIITRCCPASGLTSWGISLEGCAGRLCLGLPKARATGWFAIFSVFL